MKRRILLLVLITAVTSAAYAFTGIIDRFTGETDGTTITLEWKSNAEAGLKNYIVERSDVNDNAFDELGTIAPQGNFSVYKYRDTKVLGASAEGQASPNRPSAELFKYRLKFVFVDHTSYSQPITVVRPSSGVRRTWGMIKEMFH